MQLYKCPKCQQTCIPAKDKRKAGYWGIIHCQQCNARLCAYPWLLAALWAVYVWDICWFSGMYYYTHNYMNFFYMAVGWFIIDYLNVSLIPLASLKRKPGS